MKWRWLTDVQRGRRFLKGVCEFIWYWKMPDGVDEVEEAEEEEEPFGQVNEKKKKGSIRFVGEVMIDVLTSLSSISIHPLPLQILNDMEYGYAITTSAASFDKFHYLRMI